MKLIFICLLAPLIPLCAHASNKPVKILNSGNQKFVKEFQPSEKTSPSLFFNEGKNIGVQVSALRKDGSEFYSLQQKKVVSGKIVDEQGMPVAGVSVVLKGTSIGTISNANGMYSLTFSDEAEILVFSFVGMQTQEVEIGTQSVVDIVLKQVLRDVEEVMVIAYGTTTKESFTGSAKMLNETKIQSVQNPDVTQALH